MANRPYVYIYVHKTVTRDLFWLMAQVPICTFSVDSEKAYIEAQPFLDPTLCHPGFALQYRNPYSDGDNFVGKEGSASLLTAE